MQAPTHTCLVCHHNMILRKAWLWHCKTCGFLSSTLAAGAGTGVEGLEVLRRMNFESLLGKVEKIKPVSDQSLLEVGCSTGMFLDAASRRGAKVMGIEPEREKLSSARAKGFDVIEGFFPDALPATQTYDIIAFNDVFEHLSDPVAALQVCKERLNPGGVLILNLPDSGGMLYRIADLLDQLGIAGPLARLWQKDFPSPHLSYFNRRNLKMLVTAKTELNLVHESSLRSMTTIGLKKRIQASVSGRLMGLMMYAGVLTLVPLQRILPSDISLQIYRK